MLITVQGGVYPAPCVLSISCRSYVQGKGCTLERLSTAGGRRGSKLARGANRQAPTLLNFPLPNPFFAPRQILCATSEAPEFL